MGNSRATRIAFSALFAIAGASLFAVASAQTTQWKGKFKQHFVAYTNAYSSGTQTLTTAVAEFRINETGDKGTFVGTVKFDFPDETPQGRLEGTALVLDQPMETHVSIDIDWTTPNVGPGDLDAMILAVSYGLSGENSDNPHCGDPNPVLREGLQPNTKYNFKAKADCTWSSIPFALGISSHTELTASYLAIPGPGGFTSGSAEFIGSSYTFTRVSTATADLSVDHIEVVQAVQDVSNSVPLIAQKPTVARVFVKFTDTDPSRERIDGVTALLHGFRGATELPGSPVTPINFGGGISAPLTYQRFFIDHSLNFLLPDAWLDQGDLELKAEVNPHRTVPETDYSDNTKNVTVTLRPSPTFLVNYVAVCYQDLQNCPSNAIGKYDALARRLYPVGDIDFLYKPLKTPRWLWPYPLASAKDFGDLLAYLRRRYALLDSQEGVAPDQLTAWLPSLVNSDFQADSDPKWKGSTGRVSYEQDGGCFPYCSEPFSDHIPARRLAHEIGHNLGLRHTDRVPFGVCGDIDPQTDWPYDDATIHEVGFDPLKREVVDDKSKDLMANCYYDAWISPFHYKKLIAGGLKPQARRSGLSQLTPSDYAIVTGSANKDGKVGKISSIDRLATVTGAEASDPHGNHCLQFSTSAGAVLLNHCFTLSFETVESYGGGQTDLSTQAFSIKAPFPTGATKISLMTGSTVLASVTQSAHAPTIAITSPATGANWTGANTMTWTASDEDGDPLTYSVMTSPDNGSIWMPMETDLTATRFTFDTAELAVGSQTLFKVLASDGFNTTAATVGPLTITAQPFIEATPALDFGTVASGQSSTLPVLLTNRGELAVKVTALTFDNARFSTDATLPLSIAPGGSQNVNVSFKPTSVGQKTARLTIASDDTARSPLTVSLSGAGCVSTGGRPCASPRTPRVLPARS